MCVACVPRPLVTHAHDYLCLVHQAFQCRESSLAQVIRILAESLMRCAGNQKYAERFNAQKPVGDAETMAKWADLKMLRVVNKPDLVPKVSHRTYLGLLHA